MVFWRKKVVEVKPAKVGDCKRESGERRRSYKQRKSFEIRRSEADEIMRRFPDKIPILIERFKNETVLPQIDKMKFLVPADVTAGQLILLVRERLKVTSSQTSMYLLVNGRQLPCVTITTREMYEQYHDKDGFVYLSYSSHECYG
uniref:Uncharacterized protein n=2 Tax=Plectus sambesii TaxID=2011161 RepID=A0A914WH20_9BILA